MLQLSELIGYNGINSKAFPRLSKINDQSDVADDAVFLVWLELVRT